MAPFDRGLLDALSVPLGELIAAVGHGIADAQRALDAASIATLKEIYGSSDGLQDELQQIGYRPNWYHIPQAEGEIQVALTVTGQEPSGSSPTVPGRSKIKLYATPIDAGYASRFNFSLQASSKVTFSIVPIPPSAAAEAMQVVPVLIGLTVSDARARLARLGMIIDAGHSADTDQVSRQDPASGGILPPGSSVKVQTA
jgi:hypothetical protein